MQSSCSLQILQIEHELLNSLVAAQDVIGC